MAFYWRVVNKNARRRRAAAADAKKDEKKDDKNKKTDYAYEDIAFVPVAAGQTPMRISRSFTVPAGSYDVFLIAKEPTPDKAPKNAPPAKASVVKHTVEVPDFWNGELATSSVIVAQRIDPLPAPLTPQQQADRPYALGGMEIVPAFETKFTKKSELSTFMLIYNPKVDSANKPDVTRRVQLLSEGRRSAGEVLQQDEPAEPERADAAAAVRPRGRPSAAERSGGAAGIVPRG